MPSAAVPYPATAPARDRFVVERRGGRQVHDPWQHQGVLIEHERTAAGHAARLATVFLTGRECPWRCAMCDLWKYTTAADTPPGAIAAQVEAARAHLRGKAEQVAGMKLYNAGSFFDPRAVPEGDYAGIAAALTGLEQVVVESHPYLVGPRVDRLQNALHRCADGGISPRLEVAMGLETAHEGALERLNKRFTLAGFAGAAEDLRGRGVGLRVFLLVSPPFVPADEQDAWLLQSLEAAISCGAAVVSLVPTRSGNGTLEELAAAGLFRAPSLEDVERSFDLALGCARGRCRVFVDVWDLERFAADVPDIDPRRRRLIAMNLEQRVVVPQSAPAPPA
jgi:radical SAM enzyme (TIGR01210 family)